MTQQRYVDLIDEYLTKEDKENANKFDSYTKLRGFIADNYIRDWALEKVYTEDIVEAHEQGWFHVHDLADGIVPYCKGHDVTKLLVKGLKTQTVVAGPPRHLSSFLDQCVNMIAYNQQHWAGAMAISNINTLAAPFVRKYKNHLIDEGVPAQVALNLTIKYIKQCVQSFIYNLNFPSRAGSQTPFTNIILNFACPASMRDEPVLNYGCTGTWGQYEVEARLILQAFNEVYYEGDAAGRPFTFPIPTINLIPETPFDDPLWIDLVKTTIKFGTYSFFNYIGSGIDPNTILSMCCRLQIDLTEIAPTGGRWAYSGETGSIGVITLNMAKLGYLARGKLHFYEMLDDILDKARRALLMKGIFIEQHKERFMPFDVEYGTDLTRFFRTIGIVGLHEMCINFLGGPLTENKDFVIEVLNYIREWTRETQVSTGVLWNLEMTPAEGSASRLAKVDKKLYPGIFAQGIEGAWYYTSMVTPPNQTMGIFDRAKIEEDILPLFSGGTVHRIYVGEEKPDVYATAKLIQTIAETTKVAYFDLASIYSVCTEDGTYVRGKHPVCECGAEAQVFDRIVGYYRPISQANAGKAREISDRVRVSF